MAHPDARLIGLDWGTTRLRAYLLGPGGTVLAEQDHPWGIMTLGMGEFSATYQKTIQAWGLGIPGLPAIAAGMIGSSEGWSAAPYCPCPAGARELAAGLVDVATPDDGRLHIVPGVEVGGAAPDVMRGEETQVAGALALRPDLVDATFLLPGTHSKWVVVRAGRIVRFVTYMTGELFAVLSEHSILGRFARKAVVAGIPPVSEQWAAFDRGVLAVTRATACGFAPLLFGTRALVLHGMLAPQESLEYLSGLLIGDEVRSALEAAGTQIALSGEPELCARYARALAAFGISDAPFIGGTSAAGLWQIALEAGLVAPAAAHV